MFIEIKLAKELDEKIWIDYLKEIGNFNHFHTPHMCEFYSNFHIIQKILFYNFLNLSLDLTYIILIEKKKISLLYSTFR